MKVYLLIVGYEADYRARGVYLTACEGRRNERVSRNRPQATDEVERS